MKMLIEFSYRLIFDEDECGLIITDSHTL